jgi:site-specific DNA-cytosine methylase
MKTHVSAFAGVGAMDLAAERLGYETVVAIENDPFCQRVLAKRFPSATILGDIKEVSGDQLLQLSNGKIDLLSGGFPCQNLSSAGKGEGLSGDRSGLWFEMLRLIVEARPEMVLIENVAVLKSRGLDVVVDGLASAGYGCWWDVVSALAVGAPHLRERIWVVAVPYERMPELDGEPFTEPRVRMPRAGASTTRGLIEMVPCATQKAAKAAMGAVKRADGVTWLESIGTPLSRLPHHRRTARTEAGRPGAWVRSGTPSRAWRGPVSGRIPCLPSRRRPSATRATAATRRRAARPAATTTPVRRSATLRVCGLRPSAPTEPEAGCPRISVGRATPVPSVPSLLAPR